jgi:hypothetical protein
MHRIFVPSFSPQNRCFYDFSAFADLFGLGAEVNTLVSAEAGSGLPLHLAWVSGDPRFLDF